MTYARVVIVLHLYLLEQCLDPVFWTSIKTCNFVIFYEFSIHLGMHHTWRELIDWLPSRRFLNCCERANGRGKFAIVDVSAVLCHIHKVFVVTKPPFNL